MTVGDRMLVPASGMLRVGPAAVKRGRHTAHNKSTVPPTLHRGPPGKPNALERYH